MKHLILFLALAIIDPVETVTKVATINAYKKKAETAFKNQNYEAAVQYYTILRDSLHQGDPEIALNLGHAFFKQDKLKEAQQLYKELELHPDRQLRSVANLQMGIAKAADKKLDEALEHLKNSLRADPTNEEARYNYELIKKLKDEQDEQEDEQDNEQDKDEDKDKQEENKDDNQKDNDQDSGEDQKDQEQDSQQDGDQDEQQGDQPENQDQDGENDKGEAQENQQNDGEQEQEQQPEPRDEEKEQEAEREQQQQQMQDRLQEINMSEEKAHMILEAMRNNEMKYFQEMRRKPTKPQNSNKPDW